MKIAFLGSGSVARALGAMLHQAGHEIFFGARDGAGPDFGRVVSIDEAATQAEIVILAVPFLAVREMLPAVAGLLAGKVVIDATNPVNSDWSPMLLGQENSAGEEVARLLPASRVVKAFNTIFADVMRAVQGAKESRKVTCFIASDNDGATATVVDLAASAGFSPRVVGPLTMARHLEAMAHLNIQIAVGMKAGTGAAFFYEQAVRLRSGR